MPSNCSVYGCHKKKKKKKLEQTYDTSPFQGKKNLDNSGSIHCRSDDVNADNVLICAVHFANTDYRDDLKSQLLGNDTQKRQRTLKDESIPSLFMPKAKGK